MGSRPRRTFGGRARWRSRCVTTRSSVSSRCTAAPQTWRCGGGSMPTCTGWRRAPDASSTRTETWAARRWAPMPTRSRSRRSSTRSGSRLRQAQYDQFQHGWWTPTARCPRVALAADARGAGDVPRPAREEDADLGDHELAEISAGGGVPLAYVDMLAQQAPQTLPAVTAVYELRDRHRAVPGAAAPGWPTWRSCIRCRR
jgi:hypothetical protein